LTVKAKSTPSSSGFAMTMRFGSKSSFEGVYLHYNLLFDDLTPNHTNITVIPYGDQFDQLVFDSGNRVHFYEPHVPPSAWKMASTYFVLGVKHILEGYDHLLFLFSLLLVSATIGSSVKLVTGFTIAHSITLLLTASGYLPVTPAWVETFIAASICYVAIENMVRKNMNNRWVVTFLFGLVHGMGFAGALSETGLPTVHFIKSLLSFNLGIEFGQVGIIFVVLPLLLTLRQYNWFPRLCGGLSCVILLIACYWLVERVSQGGFIGAG
jgi:hydrogenase/urease accessory protein HupE